LGLGEEHGCLLVTRDEDFLRLSLLRGAPPKVIWITIGNCSNADLARFLQIRHPDILRFAEQDEITFLALGFCVSGHADDEPRGLVHTPVLITQQSVET